MPPSCRAPPHAFSHPTASLAPSSPLATRARAIASPLPHGHPPVVVPLLSSSFYPRPLPLLLYRRLLSRVSTSSSTSHPALSRPAPAPCSSSSAPTEHSHRPSVYEGTERLSVSSRLVSLDSLSRLSLLRSPLLLLPLLSFFLPALPPPPLLPSPPIRSSPSPLGLADPPSTPFAVSLPARAHAAWYKLFQKFVLLLLSLNHSQRFEARDAHSSPVQCATLFAPCRLRQADDSEGDDGDNGSWMSGASLVVPAERPGSILRG